jgi:hypothetical protein
LIIRLEHKILSNFKYKNWLRTLYNAIEDLFHGNILEQNICLKDISNNLRCFILCTGESLNEIDTDKLSSEFTIGMGHLYSPWLDISVMRGINTITEEDKRPLDMAVNCFISIDSWSSILRSTLDYSNPKLIISQAVKFIKDLSKRLTNPDTIFILNGTNRWFYQWYNLLIGRRVYYVKSLCSMTSASLQVNDLTRRMTCLDGSIFLAISMAVYMGFKEVYLCGCGYSYQPILERHFYDVLSFPGELDRSIVEEKAKKHTESRGNGLRVYKIRKKDGLYRVRFVRDNPVDEKHTLTKEYATANGVKIYNIVPDGFGSPVYEKVSWEHIVGNVLPHAISK